MDMLSEDDLNLGEMTDEELARAWDLWFDLAQTTNESDPPYTHGVFVGAEADTVASASSRPLVDQRQLDGAQYRLRSGDTLGSEKP